MNLFLRPTFGFFHPLSIFPAPHWRVNVHGMRGTPIVTIVAPAVEMNEQLIVIGDSLDGGDPDPFRVARILGLQSHVRSKEQASRWR